MRVNVHPARRHEHARTIEFAVRAARYLAHFNDSIAFDGDVARERLAARSIDNHTVSNDQIAHLENPRAIASLAPV